MNHISKRRTILKAAGSALATSVLTGNVRGANDRVNIAFLGVGARGRRLMEHSLVHSDLQVVALCDVKQESREKAEAYATGHGHSPRMLTDFRDVLADDSVDVVCIATPTHWHAYMTVEACKAGKDVYVEKPACISIDEGRKMVAAARKYDRIVECGTWQRSVKHFQDAARFVREGKLGKVSVIRTFNYFWKPPEGDREPPDSPPPPGVDWDMWIGPAPKRPYNPARAASGSYRKYWDYDGGVMTDWGVHWIDVVQLTLNEAMPVSAAAFGGKYWYRDSRDVPDTLQVTLEYPDQVLVTYETRAGNAQSLFGTDQGIVFFGSEGTMLLNRLGYRIVPEKNSRLTEQEVAGPGWTKMGTDQWANFLKCIRTREKPPSEVETCFRSTASCIVANSALRSGLRVTWDSEKYTTLEEAPRKFLNREYRKPWRLEV